MKLMNDWTKWMALMAPEGEGGTGGGDTGGEGGNPGAGEGGESGGESGGEGGSGDPFDVSMIPEKFVTEGTPDFKAFRDEYDDLASQAAIQAEARAEVPEKADGYEFTMPEDIDYGELELPEDFGLEIKADDPVYQDVFKQAGEIMHKHGLPKAAAQDFMGLMAKMKASEYSSLYKSNQEEMNSLGNAQSRISNIERSLDARLDAPLADALKQVTVSANAVRALEKLLAPRSLGSTGPSPKASDPAKDLEAYYNTPS